MDPISTIAEAREFGCTHIEVVCTSCNRSRAYLLDILARRSIQTLDDARDAFRCGRCGGRPDQAYFLDPHSGLTYFEYVVQVWDDHWRDVAQTAFAAQSLEEAGPAYESVCRRLPRRWITLQSRSAVLRDSGRPEYVHDG